jgi:hypothetical protein
MSSQVKVIAAPDPAVFASSLPEWRAPVDMFPPILIIQKLNGPRFGFDASALQ